MVPSVTGLAVLIDTQNISHALLPHIFARIDELGPTSVRRAYGDWSRPDAAQWSVRLLEYALTPMQQFSHVSGKNAADIALVIDAMDLLHSCQHSGFCIVSDDSDFSALATRIRQAGVGVVGLGTAKAPECFRNACDRFLLLEPVKIKVPVAAHAVATPGSRSISLPRKAPLGKNHIEAIRQAIVENRDKQGWAHLGRVGQTLRESGTISIKEHAATLTKLLRVCGIAEFGKPGTDRVQHVRLKAA